MNWQRTLESKSRDPQFLWRMVIGIIGAGIIVGWMCEGVSRTVLEPLNAGSHTEEWERLDRLAADDQWSAVWWGVPRMMTRDLRQPGVIVVAGLAATCWLAFIWQVLRIRTVWDWRVSATLAGVALGVLSIWPTIFFIYWQEYCWNLPESTELIPGLRFFILGVGLREEFSKLVCLLPLMAVLVPKRDEMAALMVSACVGLGFALEENIGYYLGSQGTEAMGRFLTANPFHIAATGLIGLNVYRAIRDPKAWGPQALCVFGVLVFAHGIYDATISILDLKNVSIAATIIFALLTYQFFHELRTLRSPERDAISLSATFLVGISLLAAVTFVYVSAIASSETAADALFGDIIGLSVMVYLFLREMPESLIKV